VRAHAMVRTLATHPDRDIAHFSDVRIRKYVRPLVARSPSAIDAHMESSEQILEVLAIGVVCQSNEFNLLTNLDYLTGRPNVYRGLAMLRNCAASF
jgi:hypothetical protein